MEWKYKTEKVKNEELEEKNKELYNKRMWVCDRVYELEEENKKLKEELFILKRNTKYNRLQDKLVFDDSKTAREEQLKLDTRFMEEDTLQELRDLGEI